MTGRRSQITLQPDVLKWARVRASISSSELARKMQVKAERVMEWEETGIISIAQVDRLAEKTYTPLGFLYLDEPPDETLPIADFRTVGDEHPRKPSPNLLETVYAMQRRQDWIRNELTIEYEAPALSFVNSFTSADDPPDVAVAIREALELKSGWAAESTSWEGALGLLQKRIESVGIFLVINGVVGNNTSRKLDIEEFRGFALVDEHAPLIFINNSDFKSAQMFTLAHELAHIFVGETGLSNFVDFQPSDHSTEQFCNRTAAEFLIPERELHLYWPTVRHVETPYASIARHFKVSTIVAARRTLDLNLISRETFFDFYNQYIATEWHRSQKSQDGGDFWKTQRWRIGTRLASMVVRAVKEGRLTYGEAYRLTDLSGDTFNNMIEKLALDI